MIPVNPTKSISLALLSLVGVHLNSHAENEKQIEEGLEKATTFYVENVSRRGGYVYYTSPDYTKRLGEGVAGPNEIWVQPPATPTVGNAFLAAYEATNRPLYLVAAKEAAKALLYGQLESGCWTNSIDFDPAGARTARYRDGRGKAKGKNFSTLDDGISQAALQFLMQLDKALEFADRDLHFAVEVGVGSLLAAQFPNGAFPQGWDETIRVPAPSINQKGTFPTHDWKTEGRIKEYWDCYNLNDGIAPSVVDTLITAHSIYEREDCLSALKQLGEFLILSQMPEPQPAWAQQYNDDLNPIWARAFEPPAIAGRESEGVVAALLKIAVYTRDSRYLKPIPSALEYLEKSRLPSGELARYYELESNQPLYMERNGKVYSLTHDDSRLPSHYGWKNHSQVEALKKAYSSVINRQPLPDPVLPSPDPVLSLREVLESLDTEGRWITLYNGERLVGQPKFSDGEAYLSSAVFARNLTLLSKALRK